MPGTEACEDHMVEIMFHRKRKLKEAAKLKQQTKAAESRKANLAAKKEQTAKDKATREAVRDVSVGPMKRKLEFWACRWG